jgi:alginate O-acetyltransferase complex protein AlgI
VFRLLRERAEAGGRAGLYNGLSYAGSMLLFALSVLTLVSSSYNPFIYFRF